MKTKTVFAINMQEKMYYSTGFKLIVPLQKERSKILNYFLKMDRFKILDVVSIEKFIIHSIVHLKKTVIKGSKYKGRLFY